MMTRSKIVGQSQKVVNASVGLVLIVTSYPNSSSISLPIAVMLSSSSIKRMRSLPVGISPVVLEAVFSALSIFGSDRKEDLIALVFALAIAAGVYFLVG